jgi:hypothetical protein
MLSRRRKLKDALKIIMSKALYKRDWTKQHTIWMVRDQTCTWKKIVSKEELCKRDMAK